MDINSSQKGICYLNTLNCRTCVNPNLHMSLLTVIECIKSLAKDHAEKSFVAAKTVLNDIYVNNLLTNSNHLPDCHIPYCICNTQLSIKL